MKKSADTAAGEMRRAKTQARHLIEHHFGTPPKRIEYQASGLSNFVFFANHPAGEFVVRISPDPTKINAYIKEQWAVAKAHEVGVPVPDILEVGNAIIPQPYMVSRKVRGQEATYHPERLLILHELGRYAVLINSIATTGFGSVFDWSNNQLSRNTTWRAYLSEELRLETRLEILKKHRMLTPAKLKELRTTLERAAKRSTKPVLNHGDVRLKNVLVDRAGKIVAIIDWEDCMSNLTHWELSLALHDLSIDEKQEFLQGYGLPEEKLVEMAPVIKALNLINYTPHIELLAETNDTVQMQRYRTRLSGALDLYSL